MSKLDSQTKQSINAALKSQLHFLLVTGSLSRTPFQYATRATRACQLEPTPDELRIPVISSDICFTSQKKWIRSASQASSKVFPRFFPAPPGPPGPPKRRSKSPGFHRGCIDKWLKRNKVCPLCLQDIEVTGSPLSRPSKKVPNRWLWDVIFDNGGMYIIM